MKLDIQHLREEYSAEVLELGQVSLDPIVQFSHWFKEALEAELPEPNAMILSTVNAANRPTARVVLLKGFDKEGFVFFSNYNSHKGQELAARPFASLVFNWLELQRQVRIEGKVEKVSEAASIEYFQSRPKGSQIGAWASPQSSVIANREVLEEKVNTLKEQYADAVVLPKPPHWGGYLVKPDRIEFWQGRPSRLHDRLNFTLQKNGEWGIERLAP